MFGCSNSFKKIESNKERPSEFKLNFIKFNIILLLKFIDPNLSSSLKKTMIFVVLSSWKLRGIIPRWKSFKIHFRNVCLRALCSQTKQLKLSHSVLLLSTQQILASNFLFVCYLIQVYGCYEASTRQHTEVFIFNSRWKCRNLSVNSIFVEILGLDF